MDEKNKKNINRRTFLKLFGTGTAAVTATALTGCGQKKTATADDKQSEPPKGKMTYRINANTHDKVSILGFGMMRLPTEGGDISRDSDSPIDQQMVNKQIDYAMDHGVNYFDTSPAYCQGNSEHATGIALHRHPRKSYYVATKMSNFSPETQTREASIEMFNNSLKELQVDYIDYYLLHGIGMDGMEAFNNRYIKNGILDWLMEQRRKGLIRNLGFSYHGDITVFNYLLSQNKKYHWDFVQIELNYLDWNYANEINQRNTDAVYLYGELLKLHIPAVIMEPILGGRLANLPQPVAMQLKKRDAQSSVASWAFRYAASYPNVLTLLSGMTYMENLKDNLNTLCPLKPLTEEEMRFLDHDIAQQIFGFDAIPCNDCKYCMPCKYGVNIPAIFVHYNKCKNEGRLPNLATDDNYKKYRKEFLVGYDRSVPKLRQANHCIGCGQCVPHCPQNIMIPDELHKIDQYVEQLKQGIL